MGVAFVLGCLLTFATLNHLSPGEAKMGGLEGDNLLFKTDGVFRFHVNFPGRPASTMYFFHFWVGIF